VVKKSIDIELVDEADESFYVKERKVYPKDVSGRFDRLRTWAVYWLLGMYYLFPWLNWDGRQAVLFDLPARKFHVFGLTFWPQDFILLSMLLMILALTLFFTTALAGRLWCGYACPQTVWTEVFLWIERWVEGDRAKRMKLDAGPWTRNKIARKAIKQLLWVSFALWTGFTFVGYFTPITGLALRIWPFDWNGWETFWVLFYGGATYAFAGILREQVCKYMCPYARFQSAMFDRDTLIIAYDPMRGEPRGARKRGLGSVLERARGLLGVDKAYDYVFRASRHPSAAANRAAAGGTIALGDLGEDAAPLPKFAVEDLGDCIDCTLCVQVCPVGIDIRNGLQYECIACGLCIDACDDVMDKVGYPRGLIRYTTQNAIDGKPTRILRPRILVYAALLTVLIGAWIWGVGHRSDLIADVLRDRNALYQVVSDGVDNGYTLKLANKTEREQVYVVTVESQIDGLTLRGGAHEVMVPAGAVQADAMTLNAPATVKGKHAVRFVIAPKGSAERTVVDSTFFGPF
jgi:polyferredoxin